ncbi:MAG TPA: hypothetical protein VN690_06610 [Terriglobales bacterium]|nr:hypothetical protein [Terriglobales bacterium]
MTLDELLRTAAVRTAENGVVFSLPPGAGSDERGLERMVSAVPRGLASRLGRTATYFVPWLVKVRRSVAVATEPAPEGETRKELCHHLDIKPSGNLLLISLQFYEHDAYGLAMEFFDKIAYLGALDVVPDSDFESLLRRQFDAKTGKDAGELTPEAWEYRGALPAASDAKRDEIWENYRRAAETDTLGLYMASLYTDVFYEDLFEPESSFPPLSPEQLTERLRAIERLYPPNRGYSLQLVRERPRRRRPAAGR